MHAAEIQARLSAWQATGDREALSELLKAQRDRAFATACRICGNASDAEDAVQEAFLKLLSRTSGFEHADDFRISVYRAVVQCSIDQLRRRKRTVEREQKVMAQSDPGESGMPNASAEQRELREILRAAVDQLPEDERAAVVLCYQQGLPLNEASRILDVPRQTVHDRIARALERLRADLKRSGAACATPLLFVDALARDGALAAPPSLCARLDAALPGKHCTQVPAQSVPGAGADALRMATKPTAAATKGLIWAATGIAAVLVTAVLLTQQSGKPDPKSVNAEAPAAVAGPAREKPAGETAEKAGDERSDGMKNKKMAAAVLGATLLGAPLASAQANDSVESVLKELRAHKAEKEAEAAKRAQNHWKGYPGQSEGSVRPQNGQGQRSNPGQ